MQQRGAAALSYANSSTLSGHLVDWFLSASTSQSLTDWILVRCVSLSRHISVTRRIGKALPPPPNLPGCCHGPPQALWPAHVVLQLESFMSYVFLPFLTFISFLFNVFILFFFRVQKIKNRFEFLIARQVCAAVLQSTSVVSCANV